MKMNMQFVAGWIVASAVNSPMSGLPCGGHGRHVAMLPVWKALSTKMANMFARF